MVFNDSVTKEQLEEYRKEVNEGGDYSWCALPGACSHFLLGGEAGEPFSSILNGFSAVLTPAQLQSFQGLQGDVIKFIGP